MDVDRRSAEILALVLRGMNLAIRKGADGTRIISLRGLAGLAVRDISVAAADYEPLMLHLVALIAARNGSDLRVCVRSDFYGRTWIEVRSGLLRQSVARLGLSPRHVRALEDAIARRASAA
jgi:hypothetical protein